VPVSSGRILIAEDDPTVRAMMVRALGEAGYLLVEATNGREALDLVTKDPSPFDLVITDVAMPQMNGRDLAQRLATARPSLPVLAMSG
jgi:CheY-like chemotaxis protein